MDISHGALVVCGLAVGYWLKPAAQSSPLPERPCLCQCNCPSCQEGQKDSGSFAVLAIFVLVIVLVLTNVALVFKVDLWKNEKGEHQLSLAIKGKGGKGVYGSGGSGLSITG